jgi:hypothetical protein
LGSVPDQSESTVIALGGVHSRWRELLFGKASRGFCPLKGEGVKKNDLRKNDLCFPGRVGSSGDLFSEGGDRLLVIGVHLEHRV